jgi:aminopeptidase-like protein
VVPFSPYGYDERQLCSPGFDLPAGRLTRSVNGGYAEYHTSADDLGLITPAALQDSLAACQRIIEVIEHNQRFRNRKPRGEPHLGVRGLYGSLGGGGPGEHEHAMLWVLNQSDGTQSLLDIAHRSGLPFALVLEAARRLEKAQLLTPQAKLARTKSRARAAGRAAAPRRAGSRSRGRSKS